MSADATTKPDGRKMVPIYCNQCVCGPDLFKVEVKDGVALRIEPNLDLESTHPAQGLAHEADGGFLVHRVALSMRHAAGQSRFHLFAPF